MPGLVECSISQSSPSMDSSRRQFLGQSFALAASLKLPKLMPHLVLLGDSIFDNGSYTGGGPDVIAQVRGHLPAGWKASLLAQDGAVTDNIPSQLARLPQDATHLVLSVGGNDALRQSGILDMTARSSAQVLDMLAEIARNFSLRYKQVVDACLMTRRPLTICTIYNGNFADKQYQQRASTALTTFNDVIIQTAVERQLTVIELRQIINRPADYANPIEPSSQGGEKLARTIVRLAADSQSPTLGARIIGLPLK